MTDKSVFAMLDLKANHESSQPTPIIKNCYIFNSFLRNKDGGLKHIL